MNNKHAVSVIGKNCFHSRCISWSYRNRGYAVRIHTKHIVSIMVFIIRFAVKVCCELHDGLINKIVDRVFIIRMFEYSARKNMANMPLAYSTLNPETNSDSPSVRSNGVRLVSANVEANHIIASGQVGRTSQVCSCVVENSCRV